MGKVKNKTKEQLINQLEAPHQHVAELEKSEAKREQTVGESRTSNQKLLAVQHSLRERVKELNCLHRIAKLMTKPGISLDKVFNGVVNLVTNAWQYPEITCARITFNGQKFITDNFRLTKWKQSSDIKLNGEIIGSLGVYYLEEKPEIDEGPFLKEERALIDSVVEELGNFVYRDLPPKK